MTFELHFRNRDNPDGSRALNDAFERGDSASKAAAIRWGKTIAAERGWWFIGVRRLNLDLAPLAKAQD